MTNNKAPLRDDVRELVEELRCNHGKFGDTVADLIERLARQRDELLAALERTEIFVRRTYIYQEGKPDRHDTLEDIKAAIAKAKS